jgi:hypothetical protein
LGKREQLPEVLILGQLAFVAGLACLFVHLGLGFLNKNRSNSYGQLPAW